MGESFRGRDEAQQSLVATEDPARSMPQNQQPGQLTRGSRSLSAQVRQSTEFAALEAGREAINAGRNIGDFILGEVGLYKNQVSHDPTQIQHTVHRAQTVDEEEQDHIDELPSEDPIASSLDRRNEQEDLLPKSDSRVSTGSVASSIESGRSIMKESLTSKNSNVAEDGLGFYGSSHYNPANDVLLRLETMTSGEVRWLNIALWATIAASSGVLLWLFIQKIRAPNQAVQSYAYINVNVAIGSACLLAVTAALIAHITRIACQWKKDWRPRRAKACALVTIELFAQWINLIFFLFPNFWFYRYRCVNIDVGVTTGAAIVRWSCWNTIFLIALIQAHNSNLSTQERVKRIGKHRIDTSEGLQVVVADLPFWPVHWWKICLWLLAEGAAAGMATYVFLHEHNYHEDPNSVCSISNRRRFHCNLGGGALGVVSIMLFFIVLYFLLYCAFLFNAIRQLRANSNVEFKVANTIVRTQLRLRFPGFLFFTLSVLLLWYVKPFTCNSIVNTWEGMLPCQMTVSCLVICTSFVATPNFNNKKGRPPVLTVWLQEFAWTEKSKPERLEIRNGSMAIEDRATIESEPMFCMETMMNCLYWSLLIYDYEEAWRTAHQPVRGSFFNRPMVHSGFDKSWRNNGLNERILDKIKELFTTAEVDPDNCRILITGHSLGGALATLAAYDISALSKQIGCSFHSRLENITFGCPRTGNHAFVRDFNKMVPDAWNIINDQDIVARRGKFVALYKRGGHRVLINKLGDLIVRPNPIEASLRLAPFSGSIQQHILTSYIQSIVMILLAQFKPRHGPSGDMRAVIDLVKTNASFKKLLIDEVNVRIKDLERAYHAGGSKELVNRYKDPTVTMRKKSNGAISKGQPILDHTESASLWVRKGGDEEVVSDDSDSESDINVRDGRPASQTGGPRVELDQEGAADGQSHSIKGIHVAPNGDQMNR